MRKTRWKVTAVDGGNFREYKKEITVEGYSVDTSMLKFLSENREVSDMCPNCIHSIQIEYLDEVENENQKVRSSRKSA